MTVILVIGGTGAVIAFVITMYVWRAKQKKWYEEIIRQRTKEQALAESDRRRKVEEEACVIVEQEVHPLAEEEIRIAAEAQSWAKEESRRETETQAQLDAEEKARAAKEAEAKHIVGDESGPEVKEIVDLPVLSSDAVVGTIAGEVGTPKQPHVPTVPRAPRKYRPVARAPTTPRSATPDSNERGTRDRALFIDVRLVFEKAGFCRVSLLPRRAQGMPAEIAILGSGNPLEFIALNEHRYQDIVLPSMGHLLHVGIEWAGMPLPEEHVRWSLSGRDIYVLARHDELNGFVNAPRLILGEEQIVLCVAERLAEVRNAIIATGSPEPLLLGDDSGVPEGWVGIRGVIPQVPVVPSPDGDILDALRPLAEITIVLEGGIRIDRQTWLRGFPPRIRLRGDVGMIGGVVIDGHDARLDKDGGYVVPSWNALGDHNVWCTSGSRTYAISEGAESWESWDAYAWSQGEPIAGGSEQRPVICGALVRPPRLARADGHAMVVPASNSVLIGATPGEIEFCALRLDLRIDQCIGFPWFEPVWAIPAHVLHCNKRFARVLLIGSPRPVVLDEQLRGKYIVERRHQTHISDTYRWCAAIRLAGKKGLLTEPKQRDLADLWITYNRHAKALWRHMR